MAAARVLNTCNLAKHVINGMKPRIIIIISLDTIILFTSFAVVVLFKCMMTVNVYKIRMISDSRYYKFHYI